MKLKVVSAWISLLVIGLLSSCVTNIDPALPYAKLPTVTLAANVSLIASPSHPSSYLDAEKLPTGTIVEVVGSDTNAGWLLVKHQNALGWIPSFFVRDGIANLKSAAVMKILPSCTSFLGALDETTTAWASTTKGSLIIQGSIYVPQINNSLTDEAILSLSTEPSGLVARSDYVHFPLTSASSLILFTSMIDDIGDGDKLQFELTQAKPDTFLFQVAFFKNECDERVELSAHPFATDIPVGRVKSTIEQGKPNEKVIEGTAALTNPTYLTKTPISLSTATRVVIRATSGSVGTLATPTAPRNLRNQSNCNIVSLKGSFQIEQAKRNYPAVFGWPNSQYAFAMDIGSCSGNYLGTLNQMSGDAIRVYLRDECNWTIDDSSGPPPYTLQGIYAPTDVKNVYGPIKTVKVICSFTPASTPEPNTAGSQNDAASDETSCGTVTIRTNGRTAHFPAPGTYNSQVLESRLGGTPSEFYWDVPAGIRVSWLDSSSVPETTRDGPRDNKRVYNVVFPARLVISCTASTVLPPPLKSDAFHVEQVGSTNHSYRNTGGKVYRITGVNCQFSDLAINNPITFKVPGRSQTCYVFEPGYYSGLSVFQELNTTRLEIYYGRMGSFAIDDEDPAHSCFVWHWGDSVHDSDGTLNDIDHMIPPIRAIDVFSANNAPGSTCYRPNA
ncbi:MAG: hypothetical protein KDE50_04890 [Caldilineaceae bacterium]|nr:hypothetical protein [Caldilineaceae bacterium]